ncbi:MAG: M56 family metallopeptidase [Gemmatimonadetes bacterium]|nr:M56 family metallopeptidase [Gemmatimonadota bacterium]MYJ39540.1 M56 family metallopeptidase [Gemmatimonadota bacterium]
MIAAWMLWSVGAGLMFLVAGLAAERLLKGGRRWVWLAAGIGTVALPAIRLLTTSPPSAGGAPPAVPILLDPLAVTVARDSALHSLDDLLLLGWVVLSALLLVGALIGGARFMRRRASWEPGTLLGRGVLWSRVTGPAVVGLFRSRVVLPSWVRGAGAERQELILAHEEEHLRARDVQLRFACGALLLAFPWNPALWLQYRRLNLAIELDCDRRVMNRLPEHRRLYGDLLLRVGSGHGALPGLAVAALAEQPSLLERRIRQLLKKAPEVKMAQAAFLVFGALVVVGVALSIPGITGEGPAGLDGSEESEAGVADLSAGPRFTPYTVAPDRINDAEILRALEQEYPPLLRDAGIGGTVHVWFFIDERGVVRNQFVQESSGHQALDQAALRVAPIFRFTPALNRDRAVPVWVTFPITFGTRDAGEEAAQSETDATEAQLQDALERATRVIEARLAAGEGEDGDAGEAGEVDISASPAFTPYTTAPRRTNDQEVVRALEREYPPLLRDAGIGGTVQVWFFIDEEGVVRNQRVHTSSGHGALDEAALRVAPVLRFTPALNQGESVPVWVAFPITFGTTPGAQGAGGEAAESEADANEARAESGWRPGFRYSRGEGAYVLRPSPTSDLKCSLPRDGGTVRCRVVATGPAE